MRSVDNRVKRPVGSQPDRVFCLFSSLARDNHLTTDIKQNIETKAKIMLPIWIEMGSLPFAELVPAFSLGLVMLTWMTMGFVGRA